MIGFKKLSLGYAILFSCFDIAASAADFAPPALYEAPLPVRGGPGTVAYPNGVSYLPDITYKSVAGYRPLKLDLYLPRASSKPAPLVLWIHGGGFELGNPRSDWTYGDWRKVLAELSARGYAVAAISYRLSAEAPFPAQLEDSQDALRFIRTNAAHWNIATDKAIAWGLSAGGTLVALLATHCPAATTGNDGSKQASACVQGVVDWFGPTNFQLLGSSTAGNRFLGCTQGECTDAQRAAPSAALQVSATTAPIVIMHGAADPLVPLQQSQLLIDALKAQGVKNELIVYPGLGHGFTGASAEQLRSILDTTFAKIDQLATQ